jgi:peptide/nickel transport system substrate-binding protein
MRSNLALVAVSAVFFGVAAQAQETPRRGGILTFSNSLGEPETYDCHATGSTSVLYRAAPHYSLLVKLDPTTSEVVPDLAESWTISPDMKTYTFKLRSGVRFHDGSELTSADIKATLDRIRNPPAGVVSYRQPNYIDISEVETPDSRTLAVRLSKTNLAMLPILASPLNCVYSAVKLAQDPKYPERNVMGTGPFRFVRHIAGGEWVGERFDGYFRKDRPYLDGFRVLNVTPLTLGTVLSSGQVQADFSGVSASERDRITADGKGKLQFQDVPVTGMLFMIVNTSKQPFDDKRVRQALNLAIDRRVGAKVLAKQIAFNRIGSWLRPETFYAPSSDELATYPGFELDIEANRAKAKRLLAEAGVPNLQASFLNRPNFSALGVFLIDQWRQIGVTVAQDIPDNQRYFALQRAGQYDLSINAVTGIVDDPTIQLSQQYSYDKNPQNLTRMIDHKFDEMFDAQSQIPSKDERKRLVHQMERYLMDTAAAVPLFWLTRTVALSPIVRGYIAGPSLFVNQDLADVWLAQ